MVRLYDANEGSISLNGTDVRYSVYSHLSFLPQNSQTCCLWSVINRNVILWVHEQGLCHCRDLKQSSLRGSLAVVPQDTVRYCDPKDLLQSSRVVKLRFAGHPGRCSSMTRSTEISNMAGEISLVICSVPDKLHLTEVCS